MYINESASKLIRLSGLGIAVLFGVMFFTAIDLNAQTMRQERREDRRENRQDRREDRRDDRRDARQDGYREGLREGAEDARAGRRRWAQGEVDYRRAGGENTARERQAYRTGFIQGYNEGYRNNWRRGRRGY